VVDKATPAAYGHSCQGNEPEPKETIMNEPYRRYDPATDSHREYRHVDPRTGLIVPAPSTPRKA
jgi:hypothetical protein